MEFVGRVKSKSLPTPRPPPTVADVRAMNHWLKRKKNSKEAWEAWEEHFRGVACPRGGCGVGPERAFGVWQCRHHRVAVRRFQIWKQNQPSIQETLSEVWAGPTSLPVAAAHWFLFFF